MTRVGTWGSCHVQGSFWLPLHHQSQLHGCGSSRFVPPPTSRQVNTQDSCPCRPDLVMPLFYGTQHCGVLTSHDLSISLMDWRNDCSPLELVEKHQTPKPKDLAGVYQFLSGKVSQLPGGLSGEDST